MRYRTELGIAGKTNTQFIRPFDLGEHTFTEKPAIVNRRYVARCGRHYADHTVTCPGSEKPIIRVDIPSFGRCRWPVR